MTADAERSLAISQRLLGTKEIVLLHHTDCGRLTFSDDEFRRRPPVAAAGPQLALHPAQVRGFAHDVETGKISEVG